MHVCSSYMHLHGPLVVPCDVCGGRGDGQGTAPSILVQHLECNQTSADQHFETKHTFDQVQHSTSSKCSMVKLKKLLAEPEGKQTNSGQSMPPNPVRSQDSVTYVITDQWGRQLHPGHN